MNRIEILYNKLAEYGQPLPEQLEFYTKGKSINELDDMVVSLERKLSDIDYSRQHEKLVKEIGAVVAKLDDQGDHEPFNNFFKYVGEDEEEFSNEVLRHNLEKLNSRLKDINKKKDEDNLRDEIKKNYDILLKMSIKPKQSLEYYLSGNKGLISENKFLRENLDEILRDIQLGKPETGPAPKPAPKPEAKKIKGKENAKDEDDTLIINS